MVKVVEGKERVAHLVLNNRLRDGVSSKVLKRGSSSRSAEGEFLARPGEPDRARSFHSLSFPLPIRLTERVRSPLNPWQVVPARKLPQVEPPADRLSEPPHR